MRQIPQTAIRNDVKQSQPTENRQTNGTNESDENDEKVDTENLENDDNNEERESTMVAYSPSVSVRPRIRPIFTWPLQYSLHELMARTLFLFTPFSGVVVLTILAVDPSRHQLLYSVLPDDYKNAWTFILLFVVDLFHLTLALFTCMLFLIIQLEFLDKCGKWFERLNGELR